jgi:Tol biopolymer transport system component
MNKDLLDQIPAEEKPVASKLTSLVEAMQPSQAFQLELENQLLDKATKTQTAQSWIIKFMIPMAWGIAAIAGVLLLSWVIRSLAPQVTPAAETMETQEVSFAESVRAGDICVGPLALGHGFSVVLTNPEKTGFVMLDPENTVGELRSFTWSSEGDQLAILGNSQGRGNIYLTDSQGSSLRPVLANSELGYLREFGWSRDAENFVAWSSQNNKLLYLINAAGTQVVEKRLGSVHILGLPLFWPDGSSVVFYGTDPTSIPTSIGLFEMILANSDLAPIMPAVEDRSGYAFSPDGSQLAFMEYNRDVGEAQLYRLHLTTRDLVIVGNLPIPKGSGANVPETANLSWSADGNSLVFDFGRNAADRAIYLAKSDGTGMIKVVDSAYAPSISADGRCLAFISDKQVFLLDLAAAAAHLETATPILLADLPAGRGTPDTKQDKLQWSPAVTP